MRKKKSQLEHSQHLVGLFHSLVLSAEWVFLQIKADRRRGKEKNKGLQGGGGRLHTRSRARLASPAARFTTKCCVWGDAHMGVRQPKKPREKPPLWHHWQTRWWPGEPCSSSKEQQHPKMCKTTPKILTRLCVDWEIWEDDWHQHLPPLSRHSWVLDDHTHPGSNGWEIKVKCKCGI